MLTLRSPGRALAIPAPSTGSALATPARSPSLGTLVSPARRRTPWLGGLVAAALLLTATPALAADPTPPVNGTTGRTGTHSLVDTVDDPGGSCRYGYTVDTGYYNGVRRVGAGAPVAYARAGRSSQQIAWRLAVQAWDGTRWLRYDASSWQSRGASPSTPAAFTARSVLVDSYPHHGVYGPYRARVELRWYARDRSTVVGTAHLFPQQYRSVEGDLPEWQQLEDCGSTTG